MKKLVVPFGLSIVAFKYLVSVPKRSLKLIPRYNAIVFVYLTGVLYHRWGKHEQAGIYYRKALKAGSAKWKCPRELKKAKKNHTAGLQWQAKIERKNDGNIFTTMYIVLIIIDKKRKSREEQTIYIVRNTNVVKRNIRYFSIE